MRPRPPSGILVVDKPRGPTSHDVVGRVRRLFQTREVGHAGTLDPMATGVLVVAIGDATRLVPWLSAGDKAYRATVALGVETDTLDAQGKVTSEVPVPPATLDALAALAAARPGAASPAPAIAHALTLERARLEQVPPAFSAIHVDGARAHDLARRGEAPVLAARAVAVRSLDVIAGTAEPPTLELSLDVSKGYYVRSLARDLAAHLGTVAHLTALRRTRAGHFEEAEASVLEAPDLPARLIPAVVAATRTLPRVVLDEAGVRAARQGQRVQPDQMSVAVDGPSAWLSTDGTLIAIGERQEAGDGQVLRGFPEHDQSRS